MGSQEEGIQAAARALNHMALTGSIIAEFSCARIPDFVRDWSKHMQKISPFLWFDGQAEEAAEFYTSIFPNSRILQVSRYGEAGPGPAGSAMVVTFELFGQHYMALNGGPEYKFTHAISFMVHCQTQEEVDHYWDRLSEGGEEVQCGWLTDKFGLSWQITPDKLNELLSDLDPKKTQNVMRAMFEMKKLNIRALEEAYAQG